MNAKPALMGTSLIKITIVKNVMIIVKPAKINLVNVLAVKVTTFLTITYAYNHALKDTINSLLLVHVKSVKRLAQHALHGELARLVFMVITLILKLTHVMKNALKATIK